MRRFHEEHNYFGENKEEYLEKLKSYHERRKELDLRGLVGRLKESREYSDIEKSFLEDAIILKQRELIEEFASDKIKLRHNFSIKSIELAKKKKEEERKAELEKWLEEDRRRRNEEEKKKIAECNQALRYLCVEYNCWILRAGQSVRDYISVTRSDRKGYSTFIAWWGTCDVSFKDFDINKDTIFRNSWNKLRKNVEITEIQMTQFRTILMLPLKKYLELSPEERGKQEEEAKKRLKEKEEEIWKKK